MSFVEIPWGIQPPLGTPGLANIAGKPGWTNFDNLLFATREGSIVREPGPGGLGWLGNGSNKGAWASAPSPVVTNTGFSGATIIAIWSGTGNGGAASAIAAMGSSTNVTGGYFILYRVNAGPGIYAVADDAANVSIISATYTPSVSDNRPRLFVATLLNDGAGTRHVRLFSGGALLASTSTGGAFGVTTYDRFAVQCLRRSATGSYGSGSTYAAAFGPYIDEASAQKLSALSPWDALYGPQRIWSTPSASGPDVTVALSGVSATSALGAFGLTRTQALSGVTASSAVGQLIPGIALSVGGVQATGVVGSIIPSLAIGLIGLSASGAVGTLTASGGSGGGATLSGVSATVGLGTLGANITIQLSGVAATAALGTLAPSSGTALITLRAGSWIRFRKLS